MGRKISIDIKEILDKIKQLIITQEDCGYIFNTKERTNEFDRLYKLYQQGNFNISLIEDFLIDNSDDINKENLMLILAKNCKYQILGIEEKLRAEESRQVIGDKEVKIKMATISVGNKQKRMIEETLKYVQQKAKGIDKILTFYRQDNDKKAYILDVADSRELIDKKHVSSVRNLKRFEKINNAFEDDKDNIGIGYILQVINLSDLKEIFPSLKDDDASVYTEESETEKIAREGKKKIFGIDVMRLIYDRKILREGILGYEELKTIKQQDPNKYNEIIVKMKDDNFTPYIKEVVREYIKYVDMDKLLLIAAYRFNYGLEGIEDKRKTTGYEEIIKIILDNIENQKAEIFCNLEYDWDGKLVMAEAEYSVDKLKRFASKFVDNQYISEREIQDNKEKIQNQEYSLKNMDSRYIDIMFSIEELEQYAHLNIENFEFVAEKLKWDKTKIIEVISSQDKCSTDLLKDLIGKQKIDSNDILELYMNNKVKLEQIEELKEEIDLSETINSYELIQYYNNSIEKDSNEEDKKKFDKCAELYKQLLMQEKSEESLEEKHDELINSLLDNYQGEEYIKVAGEFYQKGLVPIEVLIEWNGEEIVDRFYIDNIITLEDIEGLVRQGKLPLQYITDLYINFINHIAKDDIERVEYLKSGYIDEKDILDLYNRNQIYLHQLEDLAKIGIIRQAKVDRIKANADKEIKELNSNIGLLYLSNLYKRNNKIYSNAGNREEKEYKTEDEKIRYIIDPNERQEFFRLFDMGIVPEKARRVDIDSPFYNYEFYAVPDESGEIGLNSVVLAERYYEDRKTEEKFALDNATYLFRYDDLLVLTKLEKRDLTKEKVVFTANHTVATDTKNGSWASSVIYGIVKTMLSDDLKGYSKTEQRKIILDKLNELYSEEQVLEILEMASKIDKGEYTYEVVNPEDKILRKKVTKKVELDITDYESR